MLRLYLADISNLNTEQDMSLFSEYRIHKTERIKSAQKRKQSIGAELLLMQAVKQTMPNVCLPFSIICGEKGKPEFDDIPLYFSLSHSGNYAACALSDMAIGLDIEFRPEYNKKIAQRYFLQHEQDWLKGAENKNSVFAKIWTAKESALKIMGTGLSKGLLSVGIYDDFAVLEPEGLSLTLEWYETDGLCVALCGEVFPDQIHFEKIELT